MKIMNMRKGSWGKLTAFFDVVTDEGFIIKGFKLVNGINGSFVVDYRFAYPVGEFCWTPTQADVGDNFFFVEANDDACPFLGSNVFTYKISPLDLSALGDP